MKKGICSCCLKPAASKEYTLCEEHYKLWNETHDYKNLVNINSSVSVRQYYGIWNIYINRWECPHCHDIIESKNQHDYVNCWCWKSAIDWGSWYMKSTSDLINLSVSFKHRT